GETMGLARLMGTSNQISLSLFSPANTLAALLALNFPEAGPREVQVLMYAALVLLIITLIVNLVGETIMARTSRRAGPPLAAPPAPPRPRRSPRRAPPS